MKILSKILLLLPLICFFLTLLTLALDHREFDPHSLPRRRIVEHPEKDTAHIKELNEDVKFDCNNWRFSVETNNASPWKMIPRECLEYVKDYMTGTAYGADLESVSETARVYAKNVKLNGDGKDVWIFDIDETLLSNLPYFADHGYGLEAFDQSEFDSWVDKGAAPVIESSLKLYEEVLGLGFKIFLISGRSEDKRGVTIENLKLAGFRDWDKLMLRSENDHGKPATVYKSEKRREMEKEGFKILGNSGDQWSDLLGYSMSDHSFKLPNPIYYIP